MKIKLPDGKGESSLKYLTQDRDRHGNVRIYFRRRGQRKIRLRSEPGTDEFMAEYDRAYYGLGRDAPAHRKPPTGTPGSLRSLIEQYIASAEFRFLNERTRRVRRRILDSLCSEPIAEGHPLQIGALPFRSMPASKIRVLRDRKADKPEAANGRIKALRQVFAFAIEHDLADENPAKSVRYLKTGSQGFHSWTLDEIRQYEAHHAVGTRARLALGLLLYTGQRRGDIVTFGRQHVRDGVLTFTQSKNRARNPVTLSLPVLPELQALIGAMPGDNLTFLVTEFGKPFTPAGFGNRFRRWCNEAGLPNCSAHGLRKAGAALAAEHGATEAQLMAIFGWRTLKEAARYTRAARQRILAAAAMRSLVPDQNGTNCVPLNAGGTQKAK